MPPTCWYVPVNTESTASSRAACAGSSALFAYFKTELVGRTARFCNAARRLMMASAMPMPHASLLLCPERSWKGNTASVRTEDVVAAVAGAGGEVDARFGE